MSSNGIFTFDNGTNVPFPCNPNVGSANLITGDIEFEHYGYNVDKATAIAFTVLFGIVTLIHFGQCLKSRMWWCLYTLVLGAALKALELLSATQAEWDPNQGGNWASSYGAFVMQIVLLVFSPAFLSAGCYIMLGYLVKVTQTTTHTYGKVSAKSYTAFFVGGDILSLFIQSAGGGIAGTANTASTANTGAYIMTGGVCFQLLVMIFYLVLLFDFSYRYMKQRPYSLSQQIDLFGILCCCCVRRKKVIVSSGSGNDLARDTTNESSPNGTIAEKNLSGYNVNRSGDKIKQMIFASILASVFIFIRSVFRTAELSSGWNSALAENQNLFTYLDGLAVLLAWIVFNAFHPGKCFPSIVNEKKVRKNGGVA